MAQVVEKPCKASYFLPGRLKGRPEQFLIATGCTSNLLTVYDKLPMQIKGLLEESQSHGLLAARR